MRFDTNIVSPEEFKKFRYLPLRNGLIPIFYRSNKAVKYFMPVELNEKMAAELYRMRYVETKLSFVEYNRWMDLLNGSTRDMLTGFYVAMVKKYLPNYYHFGLLIFLHDLQKQYGN